MNLIEKVVIKDGVNADTTVTINQYTGQVAEINAKIAHPFIPNTRGIAGYSLDAGITPRFSFAAVGDNEMWVYVDGIGIKVDGITTLAPDTAIKVLPNTGNTTYTFTSGDNGKLLIITDSSGISLINFNALADGKSFLVLNNSSSEIEVSGGVPGGGLMLSSILSPKSFFNFYRNGTSIYQNEIYSLSDSFKTNAYYSSQVTNLTDNEFKFPFYEFAYVGAKTVNIPIGWPSGKELILANIATGNLTINLPSGTTLYNGNTNINLIPGNTVSLIYSGASGFWHMNIND